MADLRDFGNTAAANTFLYEEPNINAGTINDNAREVMAAIRRQHEQAEWIDLKHIPTYVSATSVTIPSDVTTIYSVNRTIRLSGTVMATSYALVTAAVFSGGLTTLTLSIYEGAIDSSVNQIAYNIQKPSNLSLVGQKGQVATAQIADSAVTLAKQANGTANVLQGFNASGAPSEITTVGATVNAGVLTVTPVPDATTSVKGIVELATAAEVSSFTAGVVPTADIMPCAKVSTTVISSGSTTSGAIALPSGMSRFVITYSNLLPATDSVRPILDLSTDGGSSWLSNYFVQVNASTTGFGAQTSAGLTEIPLIVTTDTTSNVAGLACFGKIEIDAATTAGGTYVEYRGRYRTPVGNNGQSWGVAVTVATSYVNAIRFRFSSGNIASGTITVWAWK